jgi:hypothetical protein
MISRIIEMMGPVIWPLFCVNGQSAGSERADEKPPTEPEAWLPSPI